MDGGRWSAIAPQRSSLSEVGDFSFTEKPYYAYYIKDSLRYDLHILLDGHNESPYAYSQYMSWILIFESESERLNFEKYVLNNMRRYKEILALQKSCWLPQLSGYNMKKFERDIKTNKALKILLEEYRRTAFSIER